VRGDRKADTDAALLPAPDRLTDGPAGDRPSWTRRLTGRDPAERRVGTQRAPSYVPAAGGPWPRARPLVFRPAIGYGFTPAAPGSPARRPGAAHSMEHGPMEHHPGPARCSEDADRTS